MNRTIRIGRRSWEWLPAALIAAIAALASPAEAAIAFRASSQVQTGDYVNSFAINKPVGVVDGDVMILTVAMQDGSPGPADSVINLPAGWTLVRTSSLAWPTNFGQVLHTFWKVAEGEPASYTLSFPAGLFKLAVVGIVAYSGVDTGNPIDAELGQVNTAASANVTAPSITTNRPNTYLVGAFALDAVNPAPTYTPPGGMTERVDLAIANCCGGNWASLELADELRVAAGATGTRVAVASVATHGSFGHLLALRPAFIVNSTGEQVDAAPGNGVCLTGVATCTLRAAIEESNALAGRDAINFDIPGAGPHTINVLPAGLPPIAVGQAVAINGYTEPGASANTLAVGSNAVLMIELNGTATNAGVDGLIINAAGTTIRGLVINSFADYGVRVNVGATGAVIRGNYVGTDRAGTAGLGNNRDAAGVGGGITLSASGATVGGTSPGARNLVSGNSLACVRGIQMWESSGNTIQGNYVGTNAAGTAAIPNGCGGIVMDGNISGSDNNTIGGSVAGAGNLLSGNQVEGIFIQLLSDNNTVQGNIIGLNAAGTTAIPNSAQGIKVYSAGNLIGGDTAGKRNVISGNTLQGILIEGEPADNNRIEGNYIGTDVSGTLGRGNAQAGITVWNGADNTRIGAPGAGNVISGNATLGVYVYSVSTTGTILQGNRIGSNAAGTTGVPNGQSGVQTQTSASGTLVGGVNPSQGNLIAFNTLAGVTVDGPPATAAAIVGNSIHSNGQLGIDLGTIGTVTPNDPLDGDAGPNDLLNFPVVNTIVAVGPSLDVGFSLDVPAGSYRVEFFRNPSGVDVSGNGEGQVFAGFRNLTHPGGGSLPFAATITGVPGDRITATASLCSDGAVCAAFSRTSEFSPSGVTPTNYRSIGTAANYTLGTITVVTGSASVTATGTTWVAANRGRGDRIFINGVSYVVLAVNSDTSLTLTTPYAGASASYSNPNYFIARQFTTLTAWEDCVDGPPGGGCPVFPAATTSLVADNRSEVGIAYNDAVGTDFAGGLVIDGSTTDANRSITLTADGVNRHYGLPGQGVLVNNGAGVLPAVSVFDDFVTVEWLEITGGGGSADGIRSNLLSAGAGSLVTVRNNLVRNVPGGGITSYDDDGRVDVYNNIVHGGTLSGMFINPGTLQPASRLRILNNTIYNNGSAGIRKTAGASAATVLLRNNISVGNGQPDYDVNPATSVDPASSNNLDEDNTGGTGAGTHNPAGGRVTSTVPGVAFVNAGAGDLHIQATSSARDTGADLSSVFTRDIDLALRQSPWDIGADDVPVQTNYRSIGTAPDDSTGSVSTTNSSANVGGVGTSWVTLNRGRGDVISICDQAFPTCTTMTDYVVLSVGSNIQLTLTTPYTGSTGSHGYFIRRQFRGAGNGGQALIDWENCVDGGPCAYFGAGLTGSLVADNRSEVGIAYKDSVFVLPSDLVINGSATDAARTITLTADGVNRHNGTPGAGVVVDQSTAAGIEILIQDSNVTLEWLETVGTRGNFVGAVRVLGAVGDEPQNVLLQQLLIHNFFDAANDTSGIMLSGSNVVGTTTTVRNTMIWDGDRYGIWGDEAANTMLIENCTIDQVQSGINADRSTFTIRNTIVTSTVGGRVDYAAAGGTLVGSNNTSSDATAGTYFANPMTGVTAASIFVAPNSNLHLTPGANTQVDSGLDLSGSFATDIDSQLRPAGAWDRGADEAIAVGLYRSVGITATPLASGAGNGLTISGSTATFASALPNNIGVGDAIQYDSDGNGSIDAVAFIHGRTSSQSYTVRNRGGAAPAAVVGDNDWGIYRAYTSLFNWEAQTENTNINAAVSDFDTSSDLVAASSLMLVACYADGADTTPVTIDGWITSASNYIQIFTPAGSSLVGVSQRHAGVWDLTKYRLVASVAFGPVLRISDDYVRVSGLQIENAAVKTGQDPSGIQVDNASAAADVRLNSNILRATGAGVQNDPTVAAIVQSSSVAAVVKAWNNVMYNWPMGISLEYIAAGGYTLYNNTVIVANAGDAGGIIIQADTANTYVAMANNLVQGTGVSGNYSFPGGPVADYSATNLSQDATSPEPALRNRTVTFVGAPNYHLSPTDPSAKDQGTNLSANLALAVLDDIDGQLRQVPWDVGADDVNATTAVKLMSFEAVARDAEVQLGWRTASELDNLGFHLYRGLSEVGPWLRLNASLVPGLGSSAVGKAYSFRDAGLVNGTRYFYRLEDVDASSKTTSHGPVSAVPLGAAPGGAPPASGASQKGPTSVSCPAWVAAAYGSMSGASASTATLRCTRHGNPEAVSFAVVSRDAKSATLELLTGGFYALHEASGQVRVFVPGFDFPQDPQAPALPFRRALVDAVVGRRAQLGAALGLDQVGFPGLVPVSLGKLEMEVSRDGTVRAGRRALRESAPQRVTTDLARLLPSVFQGEVKSAVVQITPLRFDARRQQIVLAKRVLVKLLFTARETGESGRRSLGRRQRPEQPVAAELLARLYTTGRGLHAVAFGQLFPGRLQGLASSQLRLERQGQSQGVHVEPASDVFGPGSVLYFYADATASSTDFSSETAWELLRARDGVRMPLVSAAPAGSTVTTASSGRASFETNRFYQPGLLEAPEPWLWEALPSGATRTRSFSLSGVDAASSQLAELEVFLQGASESGGPIDHHVSLSLNGVLAGEAQFAGKKPYRMSLRVAASLLRDGPNELQLTNVADTGVSSLVFLDRFAVSYPQVSSLASGAFEGTWAETGTAAVAGVASPVALLDVTVASSSGALWLAGYEWAGGTLRFRVETGHRYLAVTRQALLTPRVAAVAATSLRATQNQADYLLIAPRAFLATAEPLLQRRHDQGLVARAVAFEEIADEFGHGQPSAQAIRSFLAFAFQAWARPSPRYVLLLGDSNYDPRNFIGTSQPSPLPALWTKTSYLWTVSDPLLAAVNGDDELPDLAIGRLPATTVEEARKLVEKLLAWEDSGQGLTGAAVLVADNPDLAGDFEANARDIAESFLPGRSRLLLLNELGAGTRPAIRDALDSGLSLLSYMGHGGAAVWASENVWNSWDAPSLLAQSRQPLLLTMNCLNGYFVAPSFDSLSESLLKAEGRGAIAAFSPSGLSLDGPAHQYQRALMAELVSGRHARLGDAVLAAQKAYAQTGLMPELLSVYQLLGDPAMRP